jgi:ABC-type transport system involved in cytochrome c biogenesis permease subunit
MITPLQLALLALAGVFFAGGWAVALSRLWREGPMKAGLVRGLIAAGTLLALILVLWHAFSRGAWLPLGDNFDTLLWLAVLLAALLLYLQSARPLPGLEWFILPVIVLLIGAAGVFAQTRPHHYVQTTWTWVHHVTSYTSAVAFAIAFAVGSMYLIAHRRLRSKMALTGPSLGSLERLEQITLASVTLGFALLTVGLVTGFVMLTRDGRHTALGAHWIASPKVWLAAAVWVVYAIVLHAPINPSFRGRRAALLSVVGFVLMIAAIVAVQFMPEATG